MHSFLALPIRDPDGIVGVISLANKEAVKSENSTTISDTDTSVFTNNDERFVEAFAVFCGMAIRNAADYEVYFSFSLTVICICIHTPLKRQYINAHFRLA